MKILGIDPGTATTGVGIIEGSKRSGFACKSYSCITTKANSPIEDRLKIIFGSLNKIIKSEKPDVLCTETLFFNTNMKTVMEVGRVSGIIILSASLNNIKLIEYTPLQVKLAVTGFGHAKKEQVQMMVAKLLKMKTLPKPDDAADALAIAICASAVV